MTRNGCHCRVGERSSCARQFELAHVIQSFFYTRRTQTGVLLSVSVCGVGKGGGGQLIVPRWTRAGVVALLCACPWMCCPPAVG